MQLPIVAVHSTENYSLGLLRQVEREDALLFYSTQPLQNRREDVPREEFPGGFYVPPEKAFRLYNYLRLDHLFKDSLPPRDIVASLDLERRDPEQVFAEVVNRKRQAFAEREERPAGHTSPERHGEMAVYSGPSEMQRRLREIRNNWWAVEQAYMNLPGCRRDFTAAELNDYQMMRARRLEEEDRAIAAQWGYDD